MKRVSALLLILNPLFTFSQKSSGKETLTIQYSPGLPLNTFIPLETFGAGFDGHEKGEINQILLPENIKAMRSSGYGPLTYRLRTELANEVWHWNPAGQWSDEKNKQGYWTSSSDTNNFISLSHSYKLPRRGNTFDQGDDDGFSRIDDGNEKTFWKSNPYLDEYYSDSKNEKHPQWAVIDLGKEEKVNAIKINWAEPYATTFTIDYATPPLYDYFTNFGYYETSDSDLWKPFQYNFFSNQKGGERILKLSNNLTKARFIRIRMIESSHTALPSSTDVRDSLGFAIREIYIGRINRNNFFTDLVHHYNSSRYQSSVYVSSTDCWHRAIDINKQTEQAGIDRIYQSGLTNNLSALFPAGILYDTPENAFALAEYLEKKHYPVEGIEMGEEPDGQFIAPEDYAALYDQWSRKIKSIYPELKLGGPSLETVILQSGGELFSTQTWLNRFYKYLETHNTANNFNFLSFEWYPYDNICDNAAKQLIAAPAFMDSAMNDLYNTILPKNIPIYISEYGYSAFSGRSEVSIEGALMNADIVGKFLSLKGSKAFLYGLEPSQLEQNKDCKSFGNNMLFGRDDNGKILYKTATYYGLKMITDFWGSPSNQPASLYLTSDKTFNNKITSYALLCADNTWSVLLINKDPLKKYNVQLQVLNKDTNSETTLNFPVSVSQYSQKQYRWKENGINGHPVLNLPPKLRIMDNYNSIELPPFSLTVVKQIKAK